MSNLSIAYVDGGEAFRVPLLPSETGPVIHTNGTPYFVVNTDATTAQVLTSNPQALYAAGAEALDGESEDTYTNILVFTNPGYTYLDLALWQIDEDSVAGAPTLTTAPEVAVFGLPTPFSTADLSKVGVHYQPADASADFPYLSAYAALSKGLWVPLRHPGTGDHIQTWSSLTPQVDDVIAKTALNSEPIYYLAGVTKVMVVVRTAAVVSSGFCCVLGRMMR